MVCVLYAIGYEQINKSYICKSKNMLMLVIPEVQYSYVISAGKI